MATLDDLRASTTDDTLPTYAWPGAYPMTYYTVNGLMICPKCANDPDTSDPVTAGDVYWEGPTVPCEDGSQCGAMVDGTWTPGAIDSAYGDPEADLPHNPERDYVRATHVDATVDADA